MVKIMSSRRGLASLCLAVCVMLRPTAGAAFKGEASQQTETLTTTTNIPVDRSTTNTRSGIEPNTTEAADYRTSSTTTKDFNQSPPVEQLSETQYYIPAGDARNIADNQQLLTSDQLSDSPSPFYDLLQQQMRRMMVETGATELAIFPISNKKLAQTKRAQAYRPLPVSKPTFDYTNYYGSSDYEETTETDTTDTDTNYAVQELPQPLTTAKTTTTTTTKLPYVESVITFKPLAKPRPTPKACEKKSPCNNIPTNRRQIAFKTVASSSQFVSTPLADLILQFSIGIAKPSDTQPGALRATETTDNDLGASVNKDELMVAHSGSTRIPPTKRRRPQPTF